MEIANTLDFGRHFNAINGDQEAPRRVRGQLELRARQATRSPSAAIFLTTTSGSFTIPFDPAYAVFPNLSAFLGVAPFAGPFAVMFGFSQAPDGTRPPAPPGFTGPANLPVFNAQTHPDNAAQSLRAVRAGSVAR